MNTLRLRLRGGSSGIGDVRREALQRSRRGITITIRDDEVVRVRGAKGGAQWHWHCHGHGSRGAPKYRVVITAAVHQAAHAHAHAPFPTSYSLKFPTRIRTRDEVLVHVLVLDRMHTHHSLTLRPAKYIKKMSLFFSFSFFILNNIYYLYILYYFLAHTFIQIIHASYY